MGHVEQQLSNNCNDPANCCTKPVVCSATNQNDKLAGSLTEQIGCGAHPFILNQTTTADIASGATTITTTITRDGALVQETTVTVNGSVVTANVKYGAAFKGITEASSTSDGKFITGEIDGRAIVPLPAGADPATATFQDGLPPPDVQVNDDTKKAISYLLQLASNDETACLGNAGVPPDGPQPSPIQPPPGDPADDSQTGTPAGPESPQDSSACMFCKQKCDIKFGFCLVSAATASIKCGWFYVLCFAIGAGVCAGVDAVCYENCNDSTTCCPTKCGPFGACCNSDNPCANEFAGSCCPKSTTVCNDTLTCCPQGTACMPNNRCCPNSPFSPYTQCPGTNGGTSCCEVFDNKETCLNGLPSSGCCPNGPNMQDMRCGATAPIGSPDRNFTLCCNPGELCLGQAPAGTGGQCVPCNPAVGDQICGPSCCQAGSGKPDCSDPAIGTCCGAVENCAGALNSVNGCCPVDPNSPYNQLVCVNSLFNPPVCCEPYAACDDFCCGNEATCITTSRGFQFCCSNNQACGRTCCAPDQPCGIGFPSLSKICCAAPNAICTDPITNTSQCCETPTSCMNVGIHMKCCEMDWLCGAGPNQVCCPPPQVCKLAGGVFQCGF